MYERHSVAYIASAQNINHPSSFNPPSTSKTNNEHNNTTQKFCSIFLPSCQCNTKMTSTNNQSLPPHTTQNQTIYDTSWTSSINTLLWNMIITIQRDESPSCTVAVWPPPNIESVHAQTLANTRSTLPTLSSYPSRHTTYIHYMHSVNTTKTVLEQCRNTRYLRVVRWM